MSTIVKSCASKCSSRDQDAIYGEGQRLHNTGLKNQSACTVCGLGDIRLAKKIKSGL